LWFFLEVLQQAAPNRALGLISSILEMKELRRELRIQCFNGYEDGTILLVSCCVQRMNIEIFILLFITIIENNNTITRSKIFALS
jgi:hypothetical protein